LKSRQKRKTKGGFEEKKEKVVRKKRQCMQTVLLIKLKGVPRLLPWRIFIFKEIWLSKNQDQVVNREKQ
jgi:hypothetical protein